MFEKVLPIIVVLIIIQFAIRLIKNKSSKAKVNKHRYDYKDRIDEFMRISNYDEGVGAGRKLSEEVRHGLGSELLQGIPENMHDVKKNLNLIIDGVSHAVRAKIGEREEIIKYNNAAEMFDEILSIVNRHKV
jgi:hypothetical protein